MKRPSEMQLHELYTAILSLRSEEDAALFLDDLCTRREVEQMALRLYSARRLKEGATYIQTIEESGLSSATVSRVSHCVQYGEGYNRVLEQMKETEHKTE